MGWQYDDPFGWFDDSQRDDDIPLLIFEEVWAEIFGPPPESPCSEDCGTSAIMSISDSGKHHRVEAAS